MISAPMDSWDSTRWSCCRSCTPAWAMTVGSLTMGGAYPNVVSLMGKRDLQVGQAWRQSRGIRVQWLFAGSPTFGSTSPSAGSTKSFLASRT
jgi:hypothetical protein